MFQNDLLKEIVFILQETLGPNSPTPLKSDRSGSQGSLSSTFMDVCRICHCEAEIGAPLISPCVCSGSLKYVHQACLQQWIKSADTKSCELCKYDYQMTTKIKPFRKVCISYNRDLWKISVIYCMIQIIVYHCHEIEI